MANTMVNDKRETWIDFLRGVGIILVMLGHCWPPFRKQIYGFHMPLFFLLSGYLFYHYEKLCFKDLVKKLATRLLIPYYVLCSIGLIIETMMRFIAHMPLELPRLIVGCFLLSRGEWMALNEPLWFLTGLFSTNILYWFITKIKGYWKIPVICGCTILSYCMGYFNFPKLPWNIDVAMMSVAFMAMGDFLYKKRSILDSKMKERKFRTFTLVAVLIFMGLISIHFNHIENVSFVNNQYGNYVLMFFGAIPMVLALYLLGRTLPLKYVGGVLISLIGRHTLFILGFDYTMGRIVRVVLPDFIQTWLTVFACKCILLFVGYQLWKVCILLIPQEKIRNHLLRY